MPAGSQDRIVREARMQCCRTHPPHQRAGNSALRAEPPGIRPNAWSSQIQIPCSHGQHDQASLPGLRNQSHLLPQSAAGAEEGAAYSDLIAEKVPGYSEEGLEKAEPSFGVIVLETTRSGAGGNLQSL